MERRIIAVRGTVQGVGFRPFVYTLAHQLKLSGFVRNETGGVHIEVEGEPLVLDEFLQRLGEHPPPLARVDEIAWEARGARGEGAFRIVASDADAAGPIIISPDAGTCDACVAELFNPGDRRYRYPFLNCTHCGPRLTIVRAAPYDRERTTMAAFAMCDACGAEYHNPADRRFHAQPTACAACGPALALFDGSGRSVAVADPLAAFIAEIRAGRIAAMKGLGGYHLVCDARSSAIVAELRRRKHRDEKPFAVMIGDLDAARQICEISDEEASLLASNRRPIVLLRKRPALTQIAAEVAPGNPFLGVMLPYTPLHHLLMHDLGGMPLVMTSGNRSDEPIAYEEPEVFAKLAGIADLFLTHNRPIHVRCDDSVTRVMDGVESPIRRSRGYAPQPIALAQPCREAMLAVGGQLKAAFALGNGGRAILSHHLGDLDHYEAYRACERDIAIYEQLFNIHPRHIAHDMHPDYASTRYARQRAAREGIGLVPVQHHHAHMASCMAEHGIERQVIGVTFDGTGYGLDGAIWGGEILVGDCSNFRRAAQLRYVGLPGGDRAVREPWRMAAAHLLDAGESLDLLADRIDAQSLHMIGRMLERNLNAPPTSSAGRLFDAAASLIGVRDRVFYEGQAAMQLEWLASGAEPDGAYGFDVEPAPVGHTGDSEMIIDTRPLIRDMVREIRHGAAGASIARRFHATLAEMVLAVCLRIREGGGPSDVVLTGGTFMNALLTRDVSERLTMASFEVYRHRQVPPNDGGLSLGQLAVAAARLG